MPTKCLIISLLFFLFFNISIHSALASSSTLYYLHTNHQGSITAVTDEQGNLVSQESFYPYGESQTTDNKQQITERRYTGQIKDDSSNLMYYNARYYHPDYGIFTQPDQMGGSAKYSYANNNPLRFIDPSGNAAVADDTEKGGGGGGQPENPEIKLRNEMTNDPDFDRNINNYINIYGAETVCNVVGAINACLMAQHQAFQKGNQGLGEYLQGFAGMAAMDISVRSPQILRAFGMTALISGQLPQTSSKGTYMNGKVIGIPKADIPLAEMLASQIRAGLPSNARSNEIAISVSRAVQRYFTYDEKFMHSDMRTALGCRRGVCAHYGTLQIDIMRKLGVPVSEVRFAERNWETAENPSGHVLVMFKSTSGKWLFVEPQSGDIFSLSALGVHYPSLDPNAVTYMSNPYE